MFTQKNDNLVTQNNRFKIERDDFKAVNKTRRQSQRSLGS